MGRLQTAGRLRLAIGWGSVEYPASTPAREILTAKDARSRPYHGDSSSAQRIRPIERMITMTRQPT
jgi:hypothetical protein